MLLDETTGWPAITKEGVNVLSSLAGEARLGAPVEEDGTFSKSPQRCFACGTWDSGRHRKCYHGENGGSPLNVVRFCPGTKGRVRDNILERASDPNFMYRASGAVHKELLVEKNGKTVCLICREAATVEHVCGTRHERRMRTPSFYTTRFGLPAELTEPHVLGVPLMRGLDGRDEQLRPDRRILCMVCAICGTRADKGHCATVAHRLKCEKKRRNIEGTWDYEVLRSTKKDTELNYEMEEAPVKKGLYNIDALTGLLFLSTKGRMIVVRPQCRQQ